MLSLPSQKCLPPPEHSLFQSSGICKPILLDQVAPKVLRDGLAVALDSLTQLLAISHWGAKQRERLRAHGVFNDVDDLREAVDHLTSHIPAVLAAHFDIPEPQQQALFYVQAKRGHEIKAAIQHLAVLMRVGPEADH
jgi:hypothetical protein